MDSNQQIKYQHYQLTDKVNFGGLMDPEQCKALASKVLNMYDANGDGFVDTFELGYMLSDVYRAMNKGFNPTPTDLASYTRVMDKKGTGRVHLEDIEKLCLKYFAGANDSQSQEASLQNSTRNLTDLNRKGSQEIQRQIQSPPIQNQSSFFKQQTIISQKSGAPPQQQKQSDLSEYQFQPSSAQPNETLKQQGFTSQSKTIVTQTVVTAKQQTQTSTSTSIKQQTQKLPRRLSQVAQQRLDVARRIFLKIDTDNSGYITDEEVPLLLKETYAQMGLKYEPTKEDIELWMQMTDSNQDNRVSLEEFEELVLRSLEKQGISLE